MVAPGPLTVGRLRTLARPLLPVLGVRLLVVLVLTLAAGLAFVQAARPADDGCIVLDDFSKSKVGAFPAGWAVRKEDGRGVYTVQEEGGKRFLRAVSKASASRPRARRRTGISRPIQCWRGRGGPGGSPRAPTSAPRRTTAR